MTPEEISAIRVRLDAAALDAERAKVDRLRSLLGRWLDSLQNYTMIPEEFFDLVRDTREELR